MSSTKLLIAIKILIYLTFFTPLIVMGDSFIFPFVFPKAIYFRILVELMLGLYILLCFINRDYRPKKTPLFIVLCFLFFALFLSTLFGVDFHRSMWGNHERMSGWFTLIHFGAYFLIVSQVLRAWVEWRWLLRFSLVMSFVVGITGLNFLLSDGSIMKIGGGGTLGNQIYLANFLLFHVFIAWLLWRKEEKNGWKFFAAALGILAILIMVYNGKRGPFLGLLIGVVAGVFLYSLFTKLKKWRLISLGIIALLILIGSAAIVYRQSPLVLKIPMLGSLANISFQSGTGATRVIAWEIAYKSWKEKPLFGWGVENFYYAFNKYYNPKSLEHGYYETWFDRSHNIFLDYLSTSGIFGLLGYLGIFAIIFWQIWRAYRRQKVDLDNFVFVVIFFIAYASQNFFVFDHLSSYLIFFLILAFVDVILSQKGEEFRSLVAPPLGMTKKERPSASFSWGWAILTWGAVIFLIYRANIQPALANHYSLEAQKLMGQNFAQGMAKAQKSIKTPTPHLVDVRQDLSRTLISFGNQPEALKAEIYQQALAFIEQEMQKVIEKHALELNGFLVLSQIAALRNDLTRAGEILEQAQALSPQRQQVAYMRTRIKFGQRDFQGAIDLLNKTTADNPNIADSYWYLSLVYQELGQGQKSLENLRLALEKGKEFSQTEEIIFVGDLLKKYKDYEASAKYYEMALVKSSNRPNVLLSLSEVYSFLNNKEKAREMAERAGLYDTEALKKAKAWLK